MRITRRAGRTRSEIRTGGFKATLNGGEDHNRLALMGWSADGGSSVIWLSREEAHALWNLLNEPSARDIREYRGDAP